VSGACRRSRVRRRRGAMPRPDERRLPSAAGRARRRPAARRPAVAECSCRRRPVSCSCRLPGERPALGARVAAGAQPGGPTGQPPAAEAARRPPGSPRSRSPYRTSFPLLVGMSARTGRGVAATCRAPRVGRPYGCARWGSASMPGRRPARGEMSGVPVGSRRVGWTGGRGRWARRAGETERWDASCCLPEAARTRGVSREAKTGPPRVSTVLTGARDKHGPHRERSLCDF
jgi:hypothetical protein